MEKIKITDGKGLHLTFKNGLTLSIQFGLGNYCSNYNKIQLDDRNNIFSDDFEIAVWDKKGNFVTKEVFKIKDNDVIGYVSVNKIDSIIRKVKNFKKLKG